MNVRQCSVVGGKHSVVTALEESSPLAVFRKNQPPRSECAYVGRRALSWAAWIPILSSNRIPFRLDQNNLEFSHQHLFWGDKKENIGWGPDGFFSEDVGEHEYHFDDTCFNGALMRESLAVSTPNPTYNFLTNNCQAFIETVLNTYYRLGGAGVKSAE